ncbi:MAG: hypothetical protein UT45_C0002G0001, partial [Candidatus Daviesbacteria bacterium GW2011_GWA2_39_33]
MDNQNNPTSPTNNSDPVSPFGATPQPTSDLNNLPTSVPELPQSSPDPVPTWPQQPSQPAAAAPADMWPAPTMPA